MKEERRGPRPQRWERLGESFDDELEEPLGTVEVGQLRKTEIAKMHVRREVAVDDVARRARHENLAAMGGVADACRPMHRQTAVALLHDRRLPRVDAHPHANGLALVPALGREASLRAD